jgi:PAS domain S-box-containing protein
MLKHKAAKIQTLKYIVFSRWFLHLGIVLLGLVQKIIGVANFNPRIFLLLGISYSINLGYYLFLRQDQHKITERGIYIISLMQVIVDQLLYTIIIYSTGGIESLSFLFYFLTIFTAIILFNELEIIVLTALSGFLYIAVVVLEYFEIVEHQWRYNLDPGFFQNIAITVHNSATVVLVIVFTAFFAAFIGRIIRSREEALVSESEKVTLTLNNLIDAVVVLDAHQHIILLNPPAEKIFQVEIKKIFNKKIDHLHWPERLLPLVDFIQKSIIAEVDRSQEIIISSGEEKTTYKANCIVIFNRRNEIGGFLTTLRDITRERELDKMKSDFISIAAHQLRTPLSTIKWLFQILLDGDAGTLDQKQKDLLSKGFQRNNEVIDIVNNLLDVSEIEEGRLPFHFDHCSLEKILDQVYHLGSDNAKYKQINFVYKKPKESFPVMKIDIQKIRICIQNLVDNAIKYTHSHGTVTLEVIVEKKYITIKISDNGIGIPGIEQKKIFTKFYRSHNATMEEPSGSGLGLYIARNVIQSHQGQIWFTSQIEKGTTFYIKLPILQ